MKKNLTKKKRIHQSTYNNSLFLYIILHHYYYYTKYYYYLYSIVLISTFNTSYLYTPIRGRFLSFWWRRLFYKWKVSFDKSIYVVYTKSLFVVSLHLQGSYGKSKTGLRLPIFEECHWRKFKFLSIFNPFKIRNSSKLL